MYQCCCASQVVQWSRIRRPIGRRHKRHGFDPWVRKIPWTRKWQPTSVFLPGKFHGQRSLAGYIQSYIHIHGVIKNPT